MKVTLLAFLTSARNGGEWLASATDRFTSGERVTGMRPADWVDPGACLDMEAKKQISAASGARTLVIQSVASHTK